MYFKIEILTFIRLAFVFLGLQFTLIAQAETHSKLTPETFWIEDMTWIELQQHTANGFKSVILPTGGVEQNGPFIALGKHNKVISYVAEQLAKSKGNTLIAPVWGIVPQGSLSKPTGNMLYPGTLALSVSNFEAAIDDVIISLAYSGFSKIYLIGDHGLSQQPLLRCAERMTSVLKSAGVKVMLLSKYYNEALEVNYLERAGLPINVQGSHAGISDTSQILAIYPEHVRSDFMKSQTELNITDLGASGKPNLSNSKIGSDIINMRIRAALDQMND